MFHDHSPKRKQWDHYEKNFKKRILDSLDPAFSDGLLFVEFLFYIKRELL